MTKELSEPQAVETNPAQPTIPLSSVRIQSVRSIKDLIFLRNNMEHLKKGMIKGQ